VVVSRARAAVDRAGALMEDRPTMKVLVVLGDWRETAPERQVPMGASWYLLDLRAVPHYLNIGYRVVGLDPITEAAWRAWRAQNPEAA
jgi:hypothetical protein